MSGSQNGKSGDRPGEECLLLEPSLAAFADGALPPEEARSVAAHVAGCGWCAARVAAYGEVDALVRQTPAFAPPPSLRAGVYARIAAAQVQRASGRARTSKLETIMRETDIHDAPVASSSSHMPPGRGPISLRIARWMSAVAAIVVVALLAGLFLNQQHHRTAGPAAHPTAAAEPQRACAPGDIQASLPANSTLSDLAMTGPATGWAVGATADSPTPPTTGHALIVRYGNCEWKPVSINIPNASLASVTMVSPNEGWAVGEQDKAPLLLRYTNGSWSKAALPDTGNINAFTIVRAFANGEVWIVGTTPPSKSVYAGISLLHFAGGQWTRINTSLNDVRDIAPVGPGDAWFIGVTNPGTATQVAKLVHFQGSTLTNEVALPQGTLLASLRMLAPDNGWATGFAYVSGNETAANPTVNRPVALHYDGSSWTEVNIGANSSAYAYYVLGQGEAWSYSVSSSIPQVITSLQREHGGQWQNVPWPFKNFLSFTEPICVTADTCWAIGTVLLPDQRVPVGHGETVILKTQASVLLLYSNGAWHEYGLSK
jgi:anti-sigma factor RsiW